MSGSALKRDLLAAEAVYDGLGTPRGGGAVAVQRAAGRGGASATLVAVDDADALAARLGGDRPRRAGVAISPPPVNAHTHLDLSAMPYTPGDYTDFVRAVVAFGRRGARGLDAARRGLSEIRRGGVEVIGDVTTDPAVVRWLLADADLRGVVYWEVFAPDPADAERVFDATVERLREFRALERPGGVRVGLSPHAPHSVSAPLLTRLARLAAANDVPLQIHVAESEAETAFHRDGSGPLMELMAPLLGGAFRPSGRSPVGYLEDLGVLEARPTLVHMVRVDETDVRAVQRAGCAVVHCPRSNRALGSGRFPWTLYARHGVSVAFGTDSRGSSPDLDLRAELDAARELHGAELDVRAWVRAAVKGGYRALGMTPPTVRRGDPAERLVVWPDAARGGDDAVSHASPPFTPLPEVAARAD